MGLAWELILANGEYKVSFYGAGFKLLIKLELFEAKTTTGLSQIFQIF